MLVFAEGTAVGLPECRFYNTQWIVNADLLQFRIVLLS